MKNIDNFKELDENKKPPKRPTFNIGREHPNPDTHLEPLDSGEVSEVETDDSQRD